MKDTQIEGLESIMTRHDIPYRSSSFFDESDLLRLLSDPAILAHIPAVKALQERVEKLGNPNNWWCPEVCPITGLPFFMWITHHETNDWVPTYGGPYDSYTIPVRDADGDYIRERYDHDRGYWLVDEVEDVGVQIVGDQLYTSEEDPEELEAQIKSLTELADARLAWGQRLEAQLAGGEAVAVAEAVRQLLADKYQQGIDTNTADMGGNCDWARLEGAVKVVQALKLLQPAPAIKQQVAEEASIRAGAAALLSYYLNGGDRPAHREPTDFEIKAFKYGLDAMLATPTHPVSANQPDSGKVRDDALEEAAKACDDVAKCQRSFADMNLPITSPIVARDRADNAEKLASVIRAMKSAAPVDGGEEGK